ncbi:MAG: signal peptide peptidase SppA, partial [Bacteroidota bacterium]
SIPFFKGALEKLEVKPEIIRHGKFKSAVEPFMLDKMSEENRAQTAVYVESLWGHYINGIAKSRKIQADSLKSYASSLKVKFAQDAIDLGLVDSLAYKDVFLQTLCSKSGKEKIDDLELVSLSTYANAEDPGPEKEPTRDKIAVVYAVGDIVSGKGADNEIGSESMSKTIRKVRLDKHIKALVLRVNSPGGDALASDIIWRELELLRKEKPLIVSMGDVAASGGYYISCNADSVFAQPNTITGSIGVFGLMFNAQDMLKNKLGVTFDSYNTGPYADMGSMTRPLTESERAIMQSYVEKVYETFTGRVSNGRGMSLADVDSIGQGRVWSGQDALKIGLVDALGGLNDAIAVAAKRAKIENYRLVSYPEVKDPLDQFIDEMGGKASANAMNEMLGPGMELVSQVNRIKKMNGIQARFIYDRIRY